MIINMWSGPRNISTALMRSFENRKGTEVWDEPFYAYYLHKTKRQHPMSQEIIDHYKTNLDDLMEEIQNKNDDNKIHYLKHMTHHLLPEIPLNWVVKCKNCILLRRPDEVISSYSKKNEIIDIQDIGFREQIKIYHYLIENGVECPIILSDDILKNPPKTLSLLCSILGIEYQRSMIKWPSGDRNSDGIWHIHWYESVKKSTGFNSYDPNKEIAVPDSYKNVLKESMDIYNELYKLRIKVQL